MKTQFKTTKRPVKLGQINVDAAYQRRLNKAHAQKLANAFNPDLLGLVQVSQREDGTFWVIDGQHRIAASRLFLGQDWEEQNVDCLVHVGMDLEDEARFFGETNGGIKRLRPFDWFRARLTANEPVACDVDRIAMTQGFKISDSNDSLSCVVVLEGVYRGARAANVKEGPLNLTKTLSIIAKAWGVKAPHPNGHIVQGLAMFLERHGAEVDVARLAKLLAEFTGGFSGLLGKARQRRDLEGGQVAHAVFEVIRRQYNTGLKGKKLNALRKEDEQ